MTVYRPPNVHVATEYGKHLSEIIWDLFKQVITQYCIIPKSPKSARNSQIVLPI